MGIKHLRTKITAGVVAGVVAVGVISSPAMADSYNTDYWPASQTGYYTSSPTGARAGVGASGTDINTDGYIGWHFNYLNQNDSVEVSGYVRDVACDGNGPVVQFEFMNGTTVTNKLRWHYTGGCNTGRRYDSTFNGHDWGDPFYHDTLIDDDFGIRITVCNGVYSGDQQNANCGSAHGPFHHY